MGCVPSPLHNQGEDDGSRSSVGLLHLELNRVSCLKHPSRVHPVQEVILVVDAPDHKPVQQDSATKKFF